jgi:hypothetical protein
MKRTLGTVRDIQPNKPIPWLELCLPRDLKRRYRWHHGQEILLLLDAGDPWRGTVGSKSPGHLYVHTGVERRGKKERMPDLLLAMGVAPGAELEFGMPSPMELRLLTIKKQGHFSPNRGM